MTAAEKAAVSQDEAFGSAGFELQQKHSHRNSGTFGESPSSSSPQRAQDQPCDRAELVTDRCEAAACTDTEGYDSGVPSGSPPFWKHKGLQNESETVSGTIQHAFQFFGQQTGQQTGHQNIAIPPVDTTCLVQM